MEKGPSENEIREQEQQPAPERREAASFEDLLAIAQQVEQQAKESQTAEIQEKIQVLQEKEKGEKKEKSDVEQIQESFGVAGSSEYYGVKAAETGDEATLMKFAQSEAASIRHQLDSKFKPSDYDWRLPQDVTGIAERFEAVASGTEDKFARESLLKGTAEIYRDDAGGGVKQYLEKAKTNLQDLEQKAPPLRPYKFREKIISRVDGFGRAALENNDLEVAVDALKLSGSLENPQIVAQLKDRMLSLQQSEKPEDKFLLQRAAKKLMEARGSQK